MNASIFSRIREAFSPRLDAGSPTGLLTEDEGAAAVALLQTLAADPGFPAAECRAHVDSRTAGRPGYLAAYREGLARLDAAAGQQFSGARFAALAPGQRDAVLRRLLRRYPHPTNQPPWRRRLRLTSSNFDQIFARGATKRLRHFVVRDLLALYYHSAAGWKTVGYDEFPGHVRHDDEPREVVRIISGDDGDPGRLLLELSDATIEELDPAGLLADADFMLTAEVNAGRARAGFALPAYYQLAEHIDMDGGRFVLRLGEREYEIPKEGGADG